MEASATGLVPRYLGIPGEKLMLNTGTQPARKSDKRLTPMPEGEEARRVWLVVVDGELYVPSGYATAKDWPAEALAHGRVLLRIDGQLYERRAVRVNDPATRSALFAALQRKYPVPDREDPETWFFRMDPRPAS